MLIAKHAARFANEHTGARLCSSFLTLPRGNSAGQVSLILRE